MPVDVLLLQKSMRIYSVDRSARLRPRKCVCPNQVTEEERIREQQDAATAAEVQSVHSPAGFLSRFHNVSINNVGGISIECEFCRACHFPQEAAAGSTLSEVCCKKGDVNLKLLQTLPQYLWSLLTEQDALSCTFHCYLRGYNNALAFTSVSYNQDTHMDLTAGIQCF